MFVPLVSMLGWFWRTASIAPGRMLSDLAPGVPDAQIAGHVAVKAGRQEIFVIQAHFVSAFELAVEALGNPLPGKVQLLRKLVVFELIPHGFPQIFFLSGFPSLACRPIG